MSVKIEAITDARSLGEGPHWDHNAQALYFVDIVEKTIHKYDPATKKVTKTRADTVASFIVPVEGHTDQFVVGLGHEIVVLQWDGEDGSPATVVRRLGAVDQDKPNNLLNDGKADPRGRIYTGTRAEVKGVPAEDQPKFQGSLFRLDDRGVVQLDTKITCSNGLAFDLSRGAMYYIDSIEKKIRRYDYDVESGDISNLTYIYDFEKNNTKGFPDGMTIDTAGNLWVAVFDGSCVLQISPEGKVLRRVTLPVPQITSCTFGGPNLDILFVTTANLKVYGSNLKPPSGYTFIVTGLGVKGHPNLNFKF